MRVSVLLYTLWLLKCTLFYVDLLSVFLFHSLPADFNCCFCFSSEKGSDLKGKNFSSALKGVEPFSERTCCAGKHALKGVEPFSERTCCAGKQTGSQKNCLPFTKWRKSYHAYPVPISISRWYFKILEFCVQRFQQTLFFSYLLL